MKKFWLSSLLSASWFIYREETKHWDIVSFWSFIYGWLQLKSYRYTASQSQPPTPFNKNILWCSWQIYQKACNTAMIKCQASFVKGVTATWKVKILHVTEINCYLKGHKFVVWLWCPCIDFHRTLQCNYQEFDSFIFYWNSNKTKISSVIIPKSLQLLEESRKWQYFSLLPYLSRFSVTLHFRIANSM